MTIDSDEDLEGLVRVGRVVAEARNAMVNAVRPGVTTGELDSIGREIFRHNGARSAPRVTYNFPDLRASASTTKPLMAFHPSPATSAKGTW